MRKNIKTKNFSQNYIVFHGCGACYLDGTNEIIKCGCSNGTFNPFWKKPIDVTNKISKSTRSQIKNKPYTAKKYVKKYFRHLKFLENNKDTQWSDYSTDYSTDCSDYAESESESETGADLVIGTKPNVEIQQQTPNNKKTNNKEIPDTN